jgi:hypothetical protein
MPKALIDYPRSFQLWAYTVGHRQLLLRSTKARGFRTRVDVLFKNVAAIHLPTKLQSLTVWEATQEEVSKMHINTEALEHVEEKVFVVRGAESAGYVIAGFAGAHEDELEYDEPSHFSSFPAVTDW